MCTHTHIHASNRERAQAAALNYYNNSPSKIVRLNAHVRGRKRLYYEARDVSRKFRDVIQLYVRYYAVARARARCVTQHGYDVAAEEAVR